MKQPRRRWTEDQVAEARAFFRKHDITWHGKAADDLTADELRDAFGQFSQKMVELAGGRLVVSALRVAEQNLRPFFTPKTLAAYLSISERTVRQMLADRRIASYRVEGQRRINWEDVERYLASHRDERA